MHLHYKPHWSCKWLLQKSVSVQMAASEICLSANGCFRNLSQYVCDLLHVPYESSSAALLRINVCLFPPEYSNFLAVINGIMVFSEWWHTYRVWTFTAQCIYRKCCKQFYLFALVFGLWDLRFSQRRRWRFESVGVLHCVDKWIVFEGSQWNLFWIALRGHWKLGAPTVFFLICRPS